MKLLILSMLTLAFTIDVLAQDSKKSSTVVCRNGETFNIQNPRASYLLSICRKKGGMSGITSEEKVISLGENLKIEIRDGGTYVASDESTPSYNTQTIVQLNAEVVNQMINTTEATVSQSDLNMAKLTEAIVKEESTLVDSKSSELVAYNDNVFTDSSSTNVWANTKEDVIVADTKEDVIVADTKEDVIVADTNILESSTRPEEFVEIDTINIELTLDSTNKGDNGKKIGLLKKE